MKIDLIISGVLSLITELILMGPLGEVYGALFGAALDIAKILQSPWYFILMLYVVQFMVFLLGWFVIIQIAKGISDDLHSR